MYAVAVDRWPWLRFLQHLGEMFLAMMIGMPLFGMPERGIMAALGYSQPQQRFPILFALLMTINMTIPMVAWMRFRGHQWERTVEMAGAMIIPAGVLILLCLAGVIPDRNLSGAVMTPMLPAMVAVMLWRRSEYTHGAHHQADEVLA